MLMVSASKAALKKKASPKSVVPSIWGRARKPRSSRKPEKREENADEQRRFMKPSLRRSAFAAFA